MFISQYIFLLSISLYIKQDSDLSLYLCKGTIVEKEKYS